VFVFVWPGTMGGSRNSALGGQDRVRGQGKGGQPNPSPSLPFWGGAPAEIEFGAF